MHHDEQRLHCGLDVQRRSFDTPENVWLFSLPRNRRKQGTSVLGAPFGHVDAIRPWRDSGCGAHGVELAVEVGPEGLTRATLTGQVPDDAAACLTRAVWSQAWPAGPGQMESSLAF